MSELFEFLPVSKEDMESRGWWWYDFLIVTGDAYVDHPSFGPTVIARVLEAEGYRVAILAQPDWHSADAFLAMGRPRLGAMLCSGNLDSMVAHYTAAKKPRSEDFYSPGKKAGLRPDHAVIVYANRVREAFPGLPIVIGGLEASLRRFAHYDYWADKVRRSALADAGADILVYGMGEYASREIARRLKKKESVASLIDIRGTAVLVNDPAVCAYPSVTLPSFEEVRTNIRAYADATRIEYAEHDPIRGRALIQQHDKRWLIVNPPAMPPTSKELDFVAELPYTRQYHPMYEPMGGVPGLEEVKFSVIHNRGCFGGCNFCSLAFHQGRMVTSRSHESVIREVTALTKLPDFKGYINDVGGPSANFRHYSCQKQAKCGMCAERRCLAPTPCPNLDADHSDYLALLRKLRAIFMDKYKRLNNKFCKEQYIVPYLMSSHPGSTLQDAVALAEYLNKMGRQPEQVQDFYPTPGTISTCMYYTGIDPTTMKSVYVAKTFHEKAMQRALLQWKRPDKRRFVIEALKEAGREDLIGYGPECLVRPDAPRQPKPKKPAEKPPEPKKPQNKQGWAKAKPKKNTRPGKGKR